MIRAFIFAALLVLPVPAFAEDIALTIDNQSSQAVDWVNTFPVNDAGEAVEDNLGGTGAILPGTSSTYDLASTRCELVRVFIVMADESELEADVNLCKSRVVVVTN